MLGERDVLMIKCSLYDVCLCAYFGGGGCAGISTLRTDAVSDTTLGNGAGWVAITGDCGVNSDGNIG